MSTISLKSLSKGATHTLICMQLKIVSWRAELSWSKVMLNISITTIETALPDITSMMNMITDGSTAQTNWTLTILLGPLRNNKYRAARALAILTCLSNNFSKVPLFETRQTLSISKNTMPRWSKHLRWRNLCLVRTMWLDATLRRTFAKPKLKVIDLCQLYQHSTKCIIMKKEIVKHPSKRQVCSKLAISIITELPNFNDKRLMCKNCQIFTTKESLI